MIATQGRTATKAAQKIFDAGGNIIDAAIAASFAISVERPQSTGLGGGGFFLFRQAKTGQIFAIDFRERAPLKSTEKMYLDAQGSVIPHLSTTGVLAAGVPGLVAGLLEIHKKFGSLPLKTLAQPAIELAENGFEVYPHLAEAMEVAQKDLAKYPASKKIFLKSSGEPYKVGELLLQKDLAQTLRLIVHEGSNGFYHGALADRIVKESKARKGILTKQDLSSYEVKWREPLRGTYKGFEVVSFPPPSSGGTHVIEILNILENDSLKSLGFASAEALHLEAAAMQQAFADRAKYMGDADFYKEIPLKGLLSKAYGKSIRQKILTSKARGADEVGAGDAPAYESKETTNFTLMDKEGNVVVSTQTVNGYFGSKVVVPGTGILLNNEMDDFSSKPGSSNIFGAIGGIPNAIQARKTPLSSMSPTIILKDGQPVLALGAPGGTRILTCVAQTIVNYFDFHLSLYESISAIRLHHQWQPDQLDVEAPGPRPADITQLQNFGYQVKVGSVPCSVNAVAREGLLLRGVADPRDIGIARGE
jgi:gamma-glutamyltranspeptidase/glutathione hydrolase